MSVDSLLIDYAEAERDGRWSMRSALVRYAQPEPIRAGRVLALARRLDAALAPHRVRLEAPGIGAELDGQARCWRREPVATADPAVPLLGIAAEFDELAAELARWAVDVSQPRPTTTVDDGCRRIAHLLDELGVPEEAAEGRPPGVRRSSRG